MTEKEIKNAIKYWETTARRDYDTMLGLFKIERYPESLFFGHVVLEKILKGLVVKETAEQSPYTHDLVKLAKLANIDFSKEEIVFLNEVNEFNIRARYPEQKFEFYKKSTLKYTKENLNKIKSMYKNLCQKLK